MLWFSALESVMGSENEKYFANDTQQNLGIKNYSTKIFI